MNRRKLILFRDIQKFSKIMETLKRSKYSDCSELTHGRLFWKL